MSLLPFVLLLLLMVGAIAVATLGRGRARRAVRPIRDPACPACRHLLRGIAGPTCPECGRDLEGGGVIDLRDPRRTLQAVLRAVALLPAALFTVMLVATVLGSVRPAIWTWTTQATLRDLGPAAPPASARVVVERTRTAVARTEPPRQAFPPGRVRVILPGRADQVLLELPELEARATGDEELVAMLEDRLAAAGAAGPVDLSIAILRDLAESRFTPDPKETFAAMGAIRDAFSADGTVRILGTRDDIVWRKPPATWPRTVGFLVAGMLVLVGGVAIVREYRRGRPVPWSKAATPAVAAGRG